MECEKTTITFLLARSKSNIHYRFRWVFCQLDVLKKCKNPSALDKALKILPETLQDTYDRILLNINADYQEMARCALIWLAFSKRPLKIKELAEAAILNPDVNTAFDPKNKFFDPSEVLGILGSLFTYNSISPENDAVSTEDAPLSIEDGFFSTEEDSSSIKDCPISTKADCLSIEEDIFPTENGLSKAIRLAHFSVQEYLVSKGIKDSKASKFGITENVADPFIAESCLEYFLL